MLRSLDKSFSCRCTTYTRETSSAVLSFPSSLLDRRCSVQDAFKCIELPPEGGAMVHMYYDECTYVEDVASASMVTRPT